MFEIALALVPLFLLVVALLLGHYPGFDTIVRLSERFAPPRYARAGKSMPRPRAPRSHAARGGLLIALGFAQRPPPLAP
jgi:hypothetical protein